MKLEILPRKRPLGRSPVGYGYSGMAVWRLSAPRPVKNKG